MTGTTERSSSKDVVLADLIKEVKTATNLPICAGFGISTPADAQSMFVIGADGAITGSQVIKIVQTNDFKDALFKLDKLYSAMLAASAQSAHKISAI